MPSDVYLQRGLEIRGRREALHLSQAELGALVGTTQQTIDRIEKGLVKHSSHLSKISEVLFTDEKIEIHNFIANRSSKDLPNSLVGSKDLKPGPHDDFCQMLVCSQIDETNTYKVGLKGLFLRAFPIQKDDSGYVIGITGGLNIPGYGAEYSAGDILLMSPKLAKWPGARVFLWNLSDSSGVTMAGRFMEEREDGWLLMVPHAPEPFFASRTEWQEPHTVAAQLFGFNLFS